MIAHPEKYWVVGEGMTWPSTKQSGLSVEHIWQDMGLPSQCLPVWEPPADWMYWLMISSPLWS